MGDEKWCNADGTYGERWSCDGCPPNAIMADYGNSKGENGWYCPECGCGTAYGEEWTELDGQYCRGEENFPYGHWQFNHYTHDKCKAFCKDWKEDCSAYSIDDKGQCHILWSCVDPAPKSGWKTYIKN